MNAIYHSARIDYDKVWGIAGFLCPVATIQHTKVCILKILADMNSVPEPNALIGRVRPATAWQHLARAIVFYTPLVGSSFFLVYDYYADLDRHNRLFAALETDLNTWIQQGQPTENRRGAARAILDAYHHKSTTLSLHHRLTSLPAEIALLPHLTKLILWDNQFTSLPEEICQLTHLKGLFIREKQLISISSEISQLTHLTKLTICDTQCTSLPSEIGQLIHLTRLILQGNRLNSLPDEMGDMRSLEELDVSENEELLHLPRSLGKIATLRNIRSEGKTHEQLRPQIEEILGESRFYRSRAQIAYIPSAHVENSLLNASSITREGYDQFIEGLQRWAAKWKNQFGELKREEDRLKAAEKMLQVYMENSAELDLSGLDLDSLPPQIGELKALQQLNLSSTGLTFLPIEITQLKMLSHLDLAFNHFTEFPEEILQLSALQYLNLCHNKLTILPDGLDRLTELQELKLEANPLQRSSEELNRLISLEKLD